MANIVTVPQKSPELMLMASSMTPREIVSELDRFIIGQDDAKRAVAIAMRNRWRRMQITDDTMRAEIMPKNILMIGPTGVGKTEIARRLAKLANAPFIKVEASKFTEVGYVGRDVESIIRDLMDSAVKMMRAQEMDRIEHLAEEAAEDRILDILLKPAKPGEPDDNQQTRQLFRKQLREGQLDEKEIEIHIASSTIGVEIMAPPGMEEMTSQLQNMFQSLSSERKKKRKLKIKDAFKLLRDEEAARLVDEDDIRAAALSAVEQNGIVFIDEIDKITRHGEVKGADVSREGVQRDLLPLVEGCAVGTKYGIVNTDHILFIASGAFHMSKPSDLIPELQGRLPIRVELKSLSVADFVRILTEPNAALTKQYCALLGIERVTIKFTKTGVERIAQVAWEVNERLENIGARRLHTVLERLLEKISFEASDHPKTSVSVDKAYVDKHLKDLLKNEDLSQYIL